MLRKLLLTVALAVGSFTTWGLTPSTAEAHPPIPHGFDHRARFEVLVFRHSCWDCYGKYRDRREAEHAARHLRHEGFRVKIEGC
jgi:hypothetical protein